VKTTPTADPTLQQNYRTALLLPGGGSRAAYQVGVLKAINELGDFRGHNPFPILCGTSAGAINAVALASRADDFDAACVWLEDLWLRLTNDQVYRSDLPGLIHNAWRLLLSLFNAGIAVGRPVALLNNQPLKDMLRREIDFTRIHDHLHNGHLAAVCVTAMNYSIGQSVSFFQGGPGNAGWQRWRRMGVPTPLQLRHLVASTAIPTIFPPQRIGRHYYGDGALRQLTPISPALHLGANKILIIAPSGHKRRYQRPPRPVQSPAFGHIIGHLLNSAFIDSLETDIEMLEQINELLALDPDLARRDTHRDLRPVDFLVISPSEDIDQLAEQHLKELPRGLRTFLRITGSGRDASGGVNIASYLLFTQPFCKALIELGYKDGMAQAKELLEFSGMNWQSRQATA
jgi:NTE family protein